MTKEIRRRLKKPAHFDLSVITHGDFKPVAGASITVRSHGRLAKLYTGPCYFRRGDRFCLHAKKHTPLLNPVVTDSRGIADVCIESGTYDIEISGSGLVKYNFLDQPKRGKVQK